MRVHDLREVEPMDLGTVLVLVLIVILIVVLVRRV